MTVCAADPTITIRVTPEVGDPLEITGDYPGGDVGLWWNQLALPDFAMRYSNAPPSAFVPGNVLLAAVPDAATIVMQIAARGGSLSGLETQKSLLDAAVAGWTYTVEIEAENADETVTIGSWAAQPTIPRWGVVTPQRAGLFVAEAALSIPINPVGAP